MAGPSRRVYSLTVHADYACRHSGACCTAGWAIPVEPERRTHFGTSLLIPEANGGCAYHDREAGRCRVQRDHGVNLLPVACQQFPRRSLVDARGVFVTLSHFCPTAAALLFRDDRPLTIDASPRAFPPDQHYDALDGRGEWPPLVRPGVLFDWPSYARWEQLLVAAFARPEPPRAALARIAAAAEHIRAWTPAAGPLLERVGAAEAHPPDPDALAAYVAFDSPDAYQAVTRTIPAGLPVPPPPRDPVEAAPDIPMQWHRPMRAYLASKAFASWCAYQARGIRTLVAELVVTLLVLRVEVTRACGHAPPTRDRLLEAIRRSDWLLVHLSDRDALTRWLGTAETA